MWQALITKTMFHTLQLFTYILTVYTVVPYMFTLWRDIVNAAMLVWSQTGRRARRLRSGGAWHPLPLHNVTKVSADWTENHWKQKRTAQFLTSIVE